MKRGLCHKLAVKTNLHVLQTYICFHLHSFIKQSDSIFFIANDYSSDFFTVF